MKDPGYLRSRGKGRADRAFVDLDGTRVYLGLYGSPESWDKYHRVHAEWHANGRRHVVEHEALSVLELVARYWCFAERHYRHPDGTPTATIDNLKTPLRVLRELYGATPAAGFGPRALKTLRQRLVDLGQSRKTVKDNVARIRRVFKWAVGEELIDASERAIKRCSGRPRCRNVPCQGAPVNRRERSWR